MIFHTILLTKPNDDDALMLQELADRKITRFREDGTCILYVKQGSKLWGWLYTTMEQACLSYEVINIVGFER